MDTVAYSTIIEMLLSFPNAHIVESYHSDDEIAVDIDSIIVFIEKKRVKIGKVVHILEYQLSMPPWMIDYKLGKYGII